MLQINANFLNIHYSTGWTGTFAKTSSDAYNSKIIRYMTNLMTFLEKLENFTYVISTLVKKKLVFYAFLFSKNFSSGSQNAAKY